MNFSSALYFLALVPPVAVSRPGWQTLTQRSWATRVTRQTIQVVTVSRNNTTPSALLTYTTGTSWGAQQADINATDWAEVSIPAWTVTPLIGTGRFHEAQRWMELVPGRIIARQAWRTLYQLPYLRPMPVSQIERTTMVKGGTAAVPVYSTSLPTVWTPTQDDMTAVDWSDHSNAGAPF